MIVVEKTSIKNLLELSIGLELRMADIYKLYCDYFPEDRNFWWTLVIEEESHAALLRSGKEHYLPVDSFPETLISASLSALESSEKILRKYMEKIRDEKPDRHEAFSAAYHFENMVGELNYQLFMEKKPASKLESVFQTLNHDSEGHTDRILNHMNEKGIKLLMPEEVLD